VFQQLRLVTRHLHLISTPGQSVTTGWTALGGRALEQGGIAARDASLYLEKIAVLKGLPLEELITKAWAGF
jgi:hypothetical protein